MSSAAEQALAADGAIAFFSCNPSLFSLNADRAPQLKRSVRQPSVIRMKTFLTVALFALTATPAFAQQALANKSPKAVGPVKTITYEYYSLTFNRDKTRIDEGVSNGRTVVWLLNPQGRLLTSEVFEPDGRPSGTKSLYNYDTAGRLSSIINYLLGSLSYTETFAYPEPRRVKITRIFDFDKRPTVEIDEYDQTGNITKATFYDHDGSLEQTELYEWDGKRNPTKFEMYDGSGTPLVKQTYDYHLDANGNWTTERSRILSDPRLGIKPKATITRKITYY
jgi:YD repeat-containing protein